MLLKISDPKIEWLVKTIVSNDKLLDMKPILAGGFALSVLRALRLYDSKDKWSELERSEAYHGSNKTFLSRLDAFGDIDAWFFESHPVHKNGNESWLCSNNLCEPEVLGDPFNSKYRLVRSTKWANSFRSIDLKSSAIIQVIKSPVSTLENLFEKFDFTNCCVAYYDGDLYYDDRLLNSFESFRLNLNNSENYEGSSVPKRVYSGLRAFKYSKRYMLDFSDELADLIFKIYLDLDDLDYGKYEEKVTLTNNVYGTTLMRTSDLQDMVKTFVGNFKHFTRMSTFKDEYAIYLIGKRNLPGLREYFGKDEASKLEVFPF